MGACEGQSSRSTIPIMFHACRITTKKDFRIWLWDPELWQGMARLQAVQPRESHSSRTSIASTFSSDSVSHSFSCLEITIPLLLFSGLSFVVPNKFWLGTSRKPATGKSTRTRRTCKNHTRGKVPNMEGHPKNHPTFDVRVSEPFGGLHFLTAISHVVSHRKLDTSLAGGGSLVSRSPHNLEATGVLETLAFSYNSCTPPSYCDIFIRVQIRGGEVVQWHLVGTKRNA